jgi:hypothetical protein
MRSFLGDSSHDLTLNDFKEVGHQMLTFDLSEDSNGPSAYTSPKKSGLLTLNMSWDTGKIDDEFTLLIYLQVRARCSTIYVRFFFFCFSGIPT